VRRRGGFEGKCYFRKVMLLCFNSSSSLPLPPLASLSSRSTYPESFQSMCKLFLRCFGPLFSQKNGQIHNPLPFFLALFLLAKNCSTFLAPAVCCLCSLCGFLHLTLLVCLPPSLSFRLSLHLVFVCVFFCVLSFSSAGKTSQIKKTHSSCRSGVHLVASAVAFVTLPPLSVKRAYLVWSVPFLLV